LSLTKKISINLVPERERDGQRGEKGGEEREGERDA
jgi:hypothetical protein